jgi:hypothetical protein
MAVADRSGKPIPGLERSGAANDGLANVNSSDENIGLTYVNIALD